MEPVISFDQFSFYYKGADLPVLSQLSFEINKGEVVLVLGSSGSGKSTLFRCINGLIPNYYEGNYTGKFAINQAPAFYSLIFDKANLINTFSDDINHLFLGQSSAEELSFALPVNKMTHKDLVSLIDFSLDKWGLGELKQKRPQDLSDSEKAALLLLKAFLSNREVLLFDRPLLNQDRRIKQHFYQELKFAKSLGKTILISDSELDETLLKAVDRVLILKQGSLLFDGDLESLLHSDLLNQLQIKLPLHLEILKNLGLEYENQTQLFDLAQLDLSDITFRHYDNYNDIEKSNKILLELKDYRADQRVNKLVLNNVALKVYERETLVISGANGSGKSSLAQAILGMIPNRGQILHKGQQLRRSNVKNRRAHFAYAWYDLYRLTGQQKVSRVITNFLEEIGIDKSQLARELDKILKEYHLGSRRFFSVEDLCLSEKYRLILATTDFEKPSLIMIEEELLRQPQDIREKFIENFRRMAECGKSIVYFSKNPRFMLEVANRLVLLKDGKVLYDGKIEDVLSNSKLIDSVLLDKTNLLLLAEKLDTNLDDLIAFYKINYRGADND